NLFGYFLSAPTSAMTWAAPSHIDHQQGGVDSVSCPASSFCLAVDDYGNAVRFDGHSWTAPVSVDHAFSQHNVSCVSATFCVMTSYGAERVYNGTSWSSPVSLTDWGAVDCVTTTFCVALAGTSVQLFDGTSWSPATTLPINASDVSCNSPTFCIAVGSDSKGAGIM